MPESPSFSANPDSPEKRFLSFARTGNKKVIQELIREFADGAYNQARRIIGRDDGAEDAVQDAYVRLVGTAKRYDGSVLFAAWWGRLVHTAAIDYRRQMHRQRRFSGPIDQGVSVMNHGQSAASESMDPPQIESLRAALESLPNRYRDPLTMHYLGGLSRNATAQALGIGEETIKTQLARGLEFLREKLGRAGMTATSAGLLTAFANLPTYAAPPSLKANLAAVASERMGAASGQVSHHLLGVKKVSALATGAGVFTTAVVSVLAVAATVTWSRRPDSVPMPVVAAPATMVYIGNDPVGHWKLDETSGMITADSSGNHANGTLENYSTPGWTTGKLGGALDFDGLSNAVVVGSPPALNDLPRFTIAAWIMPRSSGQSAINNEGFQVSYGRIVNKRVMDAETTPDWGGGWSLYVSSGGFTSGTICFLRSFSITEGKWAAPDNSVTLGSWQHVALTYDNSSAANEPVFYLNGIPVTTTVLAAPSGLVSSDAVATLSIGNTNRMTRTFDGVIDDVRIYNRVLNASEIQDLATGDNSSRN